MAELFSFIYFCCVTIIFMNQAFIDDFATGLSTLSKTERIPKMEAYMKNLFPFAGVMATERRQLFKELSAGYDLKKAGFDKDLVLTLWDKPQREFSYAALDYIALFEKKLKAENLELIEALIVSKSWWDTVDFLAVHAVGSILAKQPELISDKTSQWIAADNIWLNRTAIIFQLNYKDKTDEVLLYHCIEKVKHNKEFFIQKAIGWALRQYSRTNAEFVRNSVETLQLVGLAKREALRLM